MREGGRKTKRRAEKDEGKTELKATIAESLISAQTTVVRLVCSVTASSLKIKKSFLLSTIKF